MTNSRGMERESRAQEWTRTAGGTHWLRRQLLLRRQLRLLHHRTRGVSGCPSPRHQAVAVAGEEGKGRTNNEQQANSNKNNLSFSQQLFEWERSVLISCLFFPRPPFSHFLAHLHLLLRLLRHAHRPFIYFVCAANTTGGGCGSKKVSKQVFLLGVSKQRRTLMR